MAEPAIPQPPAVRPYVSAETKRWRDAADELAPAKAFARLIDNGRFVIGTVSTVGVLLTGFGLVAADRLSDSVGPSRLAAAAVALAVVAILLALLPLVIRTRRINLDNLAEVQQLYTRELGKARLISAAGWTLAVALALAGAAATWAAMSADALTPAQPHASLTAASGKDGMTIHVSAMVSRLKPGEQVRFKLTTAGGAVLLRGSAVADTGGVVSLDEMVVDETAGGYYEFVVDPPGASSTTVVSDAG